MVDNSNMPHPKCLGSQKNPGTEPKTCEKGPKLGFEYLPTSKTSQCMPTACMAFPMLEIGGSKHACFFGGSCTVDRAHLRPQSTERIPARVQNANIHAHRQTLLRYRPGERVFESDFLSVFRHK